MKNEDQGSVKSVKTDKGYKGMTPNTAQKRPNTIKPSPAKSFNLYRQQGK